MSNRKCFWILTFCLVTFSHNLFSQIIVQGMVKDSDSLAVENALVELIDQADITRIFGNYTDKQGQFIIQITETRVNDNRSQIPGTFHLFQNYPNPFNPSTIIEYELAKPAYVTIEIYNILGQKIKTMFKGYQSNRMGRIIWDATNDMGQGVSAGVYIYSLKADGIRTSRKMLLMDGYPGRSNFTLSKATGVDSYNKSILKKQMSYQYLLKVTGNNIETYEQQNLVITDNMNFNIKVVRSTVTDIDNNVYRTIRIGNQWWMAENLKVTHYCNGDVIPNVTGNSEWESLTTGAYCIYDNNIDNVTTYGRLYNWYAVNDSRQLAPAGWHVPSDTEWQTLIDYLGGDAVAGGKMKESGYTHWMEYCAGATNESGFSALPGAGRDYYGHCYSMGTNASFWSSTGYDSNGASARWLRCEYSDVNRDYYFKQLGFSVRLVRDNSNANVAPIAFFTVNFGLANIETIFTCDASGCSDNEDTISALQVRWDWENDGIWDTVYSTTKTASHKYSAAGLKTIKMEVKDTGDLIDIFTQQIAVIESGTVTDTDGNTYQTVKIGDQWWMAENLKVTHYRNGDVIPNIIDDSEWSSLSTGANCDYANNSDNVATYGRLYNWYAVTDSRNIARAGWHMPSDAEWQTLIDYLGGDFIAGGKMKETGTTHWKSPNTGATNESGFTALPGGYRPYGGGYYPMSSYAGFWSFTEISSNLAWGRLLSYDNSEARRNNGYCDKRFGYSVRLVKDSVNVALVASFTVTPDSGTTTTIFNFDASGCSDVEDPVNDLQVRWDWENDGTWDTNYSTIKTATHQYSKIGTFTIKMQVKDTGNLTDIYTQQITVKGSVMDIDGNVYNTVEIGNQLWLAENLKVMHYRNGDDIPYVTSNSEWETLTTGAYCIYNNNKHNLPTYGRLYNWYAVNDSRNIALEGWHVPSDVEWQTLINNLGGYAVAGGKLKETGYTHWLEPNTGATNESAFSALPGGYRINYGGEYDFMGHDAIFWSSTENRSGDTGGRDLSYNYSGVSSYLGKFKPYGFSVRLVKDSIKK
jgi:uncharacterized protein (TIGR02145 family)